MTSNFRVDMFELKNHALKLVRTQKTSQVWAALLQKNKVRICMAPPVDLAVNNG